jgi:hypothetical protein
MTEKRRGPESIQSQVRADLVERERLGIERYGTALYPHNGRDALQDAYEEALDMCQYLKQALVEKGAATAPLRTRQEVDAEIAERVRQYHRHEPPGIRSWCESLVEDINRLCSEPTADEPSLVDRVLASDESEACSCDESEALKRELRGCQASLASRTEEAKDACQKLMDIQTEYDIWNVGKKSSAATLDPIGLILKP